jgi:uncharacterized protein YndB with AHSA1/START domain
MADQPLGDFVDRYTFKYERFYPYPVERVWKAVTTAEELDAWMMPSNFVEARPGGAFGFGFGGSLEEALRGVIGEFREREVIDYAFDNGSSMRFELREQGGGTHLTFVHSFPGPGEEMRGDPGGDLPGGPDTPWRPGFMAGFYLCLEQLGPWMEGRWTLEDSVAAVRRNAARDYDPEWLRLSEKYREHVIKTIPGGVRN